jgi:hypothetical protein
VNSGQIQTRDGKRTPLLVCTVLTGSFPPAQDGGCSNWLVDLFCMAWSMRDRVFHMERTD